MDNAKVVVRNSNFGKGLFAAANIGEGEVVAVFDGAVYVADKATDLAEEIADHAVQIGPHEWKDSNGFARYINHSCEPNVGYRGVDTLVAMRDITRGEELRLDYDMSENSDWRMQCECGAKTCRRVVGAYSNLSQEVRNKYNGYISDWLKH
jgi:hypothetical protein